MDKENLLGESNSHFRRTWQFYYEGVSLLPVLHGKEFTGIMLKV